MSTYEVSTAVFEGPLDLLLQLISRRQLEITSISLLDLVDEYVRHLASLDRFDMEVTSEFLLIASTLIQLKARRLLPEDRPVDLDEELALMEERDRLLSRLLACVTYKDVAAVIGHRLREGERYVAREGGMDPDVTARPPDTILPVDAVGLHAVATRLFAAREASPDLDHLDLSLPSVADAIDDLQRRIRELAESSFDELVAHAEREVEVVAYFLALLELARWGLVAVTQEDVYETISVRQLAEGSVRGSEWA